MELNKYQEEALDRFDRWQNALAEEHKKSADLVEQYKKADLDISDQMKNYPKHAWRAMAGKNDVADTGYVSRNDKANRPIPHACFKIPTGGGKTLMAAAVLERLNLRAGLVLWVVPTMKIYEQTRDALRAVGSPIRVRLEYGSGWRVKFMEKDNRFCKDDVEQYLCVMLLSLAAVNRNKNKEFLRMNRDSDNYQSFFPDADDMVGNANLLKDQPGLMQDGNGQVRHSLANVFRMMRPVVILDEAHKAYRSGGLEYAGMINQLNPSLVVEMSATPNPGISNLLVNVSGNDLWKEEMIKMPIDLNVQTDPDWKHLLDTAHANRGQLENDAKTLQSQTGKYIRPIALVRVERTGKNQRDGTYIHTDDARDYLMKKLAVPPSHIAVQSSTKKELKGINLLSEATEIRWIITKDAIKEGWDCPFAYVLAILDSIQTHTSITQLLGRVLRQPGARRTNIDSLDRCYVYCHNPDTGIMAEYVRRGLSEAGMEDVEFALKSDEPEKKKIIEKHLKRRNPIFLPLVLHKDGKGLVGLEYERHILSGVDFGAVSAPDPSDFKAQPQGWTRTIIKLGEDSPPSLDLEAHESKSAGVVDFARPLSDIVPNVWQAARIAQEFLEKLRKAGKTETDIYNGMPYLVKVLRDHVTEATNREAERVFRNKVRRGNIRFDLEIEDGNYQIKTYKVEQGNLLTIDNNPARRSLFKPVFKEEFDTDLERSFAKYLDAKTVVNWWHRVAARQRDGYHLKGWKKNYIYPDFVAMTNESGDKVRLGIYDTKAEYLDNPDTRYKKEVLKTLEDTFNCGTVTIRGSRLRGEFRLVFEGKFEEILS